MKRNSLKLARALSYITLFFAAALPLIAVMIWSFWDQLAPLAAGNLQHRYNLAGLSTGERLAGFAISITGAFIQSIGLLGLKNTFTEASEGRAYSDLALRGFRRFAWITLLMVPVGIMQNALFIVLYSLSDPAHEGTLQITLGTPEIKSLFIGLLLVFVALVFADGKAAKDENDSFL